MKRKIIMFAVTTIVPMVASYLIKKYWSDRDANEGARA